MQGKRKRLTASLREVLQCGICFFVPFFVILRQGIVRNIPILSGGGAGVAREGGEREGMRMNE